MQVHHVAGAVVFQFDVVAEMAGEEEVVHGVFGGEERGGHIEETVFDLDVEVRIDHEGVDQIAFDVGRTGEKAGAGVVFPIPIAADFAAESLVGTS